MFQLAILLKIAPMLLIVALAPAAIAGMSKYHHWSPGIVAGSNINADLKTISPAIVISLVTFPLLPAETAKRVSVMHILKTFYSLAVMYCETELTSTVLAGHYSRDCDQPKDWSKVQCKNCGESELITCTFLILELVC